MSDFEEDTYCWKCSDFINKYEQSVLGLCNSCREDLQFMVFVFIWLLFIPFTSVVVAAVFGYSTVAEMIIAVVTAALCEVLLGLIIYGTAFVLRHVIRYLWEWVIAFVRLLAEIHRNKTKKEALKTSERTRLAEPKVLNGMELDALLTEEYKEKMGWK